MSTRRRFLASLIASLALSPVLCRAAKAVRVEIPEPVESVEVWNVWIRFANEVATGFSYAGTLVGDSVIQRKPSLDEMHSMPSIYVL